MGTRIGDSVRQEVIRLRVECRLGLKAICRATQVSRGTASNLLKDHPLTKEEVSTRQATQGKATAEQRGRYSPLPSKHAASVAGMSREQKGNVAEAAVLFRLSLHGLEVWKSQYDGNKADWLVTKPCGRKCVRLQVRWSKREKYGRPLIRLRKGGGRLVDLEDCDFVVGYDLETDTAFVVPLDNLHGRSYVSCDPVYEEAWNLVSDKLAI